MTALIKEECEKKIHADPVYRGALLHYLYLMADTCITLGEVVIREKGLRPPQSYFEMFDILGGAGLLKSDFAYKFAKIAGFRNFLAHDYENVDAKIICNETLGKLGEVKEFLSRIDQAIN